MCRCTYCEYHKREKEERQRKHLKWCANIQSEAIRKFRLALKKIADVECGNDCEHRIPPVPKGWICVHEIAHKALEADRG